VRSLAVYASLPGAGSGCADACKAESSSALTLLMFVLANSKQEQHPGLERYPPSLNPWRSRTNGMKPRRSPDGDRSTSPAHLRSHSLCGAQTRYSEDDE
jgi:hypothetical protein